MAGQANVKFQTKRDLLVSLTFFVLSTFRVFVIGSVLSFLVLAFKHLDLIGHLDFDICHSNPVNVTPMVRSLTLYWPTGPDIPNLNMKLRIPLLCQKQIPFH
jgi:hypothetical protein